MSFLKKLLGGDFTSNRAEGDAYFAENRFGDAKLSYERALDKAKHELDSNLEAVRERISLCRDRLAEQHRDRARALVEEGDLEAALEVLASAVEVAASPDLRTQLKEDIDRVHVVDAGTPSVEEGTATPEDRFDLLSADWEDEQLEEYEAYGEPFRDALLVLHDRHEESDLRGALSVLRDLTTSAGDRARYIYLELGRAELALGNRAEGIRGLTELLQRLPEDGSAVAKTHALLALAETCVESEEYSEAERHLVQACEVAPDFVASHLRLGRFLRQRGRHQDAAKSLEQAVRLMGEMRPDIRVIREVGLNLLGLGKEDQAVETLEDLIQVQASMDGMDLDPEAVVALAGIYEKRGDPRHAADLYRHLCRGSDRGNSFRYHKEVARLLVAAGHRDQAREYVIKARELAPDEEARKAVSDLLPASQ